MCFQDGAARHARPHVGACPMRWVLKNASGPAPCPAMNHAVDVYPEKPNRIVPRSNPEPALVDQANATLSNMSVLRDTGKAPPERFALPVTANMEYGFFNSVQVGQGAV